MGDGEMTNIPTELLRTLIAVVDLRSFTKAAHSLGVTQPAVSAQIKRLQMLLGSELLDKSAPGVMLTSTGELVVSYARRLLQINDQILHLAGPRPAARKFRLGIAADFASPVLTWTLAGFRTRWSDVCFEVRNGPNEVLLHELHLGELDLIVTVSGMKSESDARHQWTEDLVWVRGASTNLDANGPVAVASCGEACAQHRLAVSALEQAGRGYQVVFTAPSLAEVTSAVVSGLGIMALASSRVANTDLLICDERLLPKLPSVICSICISEGGDREPLEHLADALAEILQAQRTLGPHLHCDESEGDSPPIEELEASLGRRATGS
jgi:DNA-binding transcriptional LysR family regulator